MNTVNTNLYEYEITDDVTVRFTVSVFNGKEYYHIREYYKGYPTKKGIKFGLEEFPEFAKGLIKLKDHIDNKRS